MNTSVNYSGSQLDGLQRFSRGFPLSDVMKSVYVYFLELQDNKRQYYFIRGNLNFYFSGVHFWVVLKTANAKQKCWKNLSSNIISIYFPGNFSRCISVKISIIYL